MIRSPSFSEALEIRLEAIRERGLYRKLRRVDSPQAVRIQIEGQSLLNFSSNDYLGLASDPRLTEAAVQAVKQFGAGAGASRLICGSLAPHHELEDALAAFKGTEAALSFSSGYAAALGVIGALLEHQDVIIIDKRVHACLVDAAKLSGAKLRVFAHNDLEDLDSILKWANQRTSATSATRRAQILIVTESVFSMDGDHAPLDQMADLKDRYGAWLMVDEAHATGLYGPRRRGLADAFGVNDRIEIQMGTLGKALGSAGGYVCGSRALIDLLVNRARSFIFSTAPPPASAAAARAALEIVQSQDGEARCKTLWQRAAQIVAARNLHRAASSSASSPCEARAGRGPRREETNKDEQPLPDPLLRPMEEREESRSLMQPCNFQSQWVDKSGSTNPGLPTEASAIIPILIGDETRAVEAAQALRAAGIFIPAIRHPSVPRGRARLRLTVTADHTAEEVAQLLKAVSDLKLPL